MKYRIFLSEKLDKRWISIYNRNDCVFIIIDYFLRRDLQWQRKALSLSVQAMPVFQQPSTWQKIEKDNDVEITLIDRHSYHTMMTELHEVAGDVSSRPQSNMTCNVCFHVRKMFA